MRKPRATLSGGFSERFQSLQSTHQSVQHSLFAVLISHDQQLKPNESEQLGTLWRQVAMIDCRRAAKYARPYCTLTYLFFTITINALYLL